MGSRPLPSGRSPRKPCANTGSSRPPRRGRTPSRDWFLRSEARRCLCANKLFARLVSRRFARMVKYFPRIFPLLLMVGAGTAFSQAPNWTKQTPQTMPLTLAFPAMAYDSAHQQTVLFGGYLGVGSLYYEYNITWVWDGTNWTKKTPATNPQPRDSESMVYDSVRGQVVMFGGENLTGSPFGDTWIWDGTTWTLQNTPTAPSARYHTMMAFDAAHGQVVLFGGSDGNGNYYNDTWVWNGTAWSQKTPSASPPARWRGMMTFDSARNQTVMFGGY